MKKEKFTLNIKIKNVTAAQAVAIESYLSMWQTLGGLGSSRWTSFFADGDGNFRPKVEVNGRVAQHTAILDKDQVWDGNQYKIDFDSIAWVFHDDKERMKTVKFLRTPIFINKIISIFKFWKERYAKRKKSRSNKHLQHRRVQWENDQRKQPGEDS